MKTRSTNVTKAIRSGCLFATLLLCSFSLSAQFSVVTSNNSDTGPYALVSTCNELNNAVFTNTIGSIYAVTYDDGAQNNGNKIRFCVIDPCTPATAFWGITGIPGNVTYTNPDIVLGGDDTHFYLGIVYTAESLGHKAILFEAYTITGVCGTLTVTNCTNGVIKFAGTTTYDADSAHIDMLNTYSNSLNQFVSDMFVASWQDKACFANAGNWGTNARYGSLSQQAGSCILANTTAAGNCVNKTSGSGKFDTWSSDVAAFPGDWGKAALFTYINKDNGGTLDTSRWDITNTNNPSWSYGSIEPTNTNVISQPRIDINDWANSGTYQFVAAFKYDNGTTIDINQTNNYISGSEAITSYYSYMSSGTGDLDNTSPVVTAGPNTSDGMFTVAYANPYPGIDTTFAQDIDMATGLATVDLNGDDLYYQVSRSAGGGAGPVAISNDYLTSCGSSCVIYPDQVYVCWYNSTSDRIDCKHTNSVGPTFKPNPTAVKQVYRYDASPGILNIYPSPAHEQVSVAADKEMSSYQLIDMLGHTVHEGHIGAKNAKFDISSLPVGTYILRVENKDGSKSVSKFEKQ